MSSRSIVRLTIFSLCGVAALLCGLTEALIAQPPPPPLPPPQLGRPGGDQGNNAQDRGRGGPPSSSLRGGRGRSNFQGADSSFGSSKPKFDELLADRDLSRFRGYHDEEIGDGWEIDGKYLHFDGSGGGDIITRNEYENFELQFDYKVSKGGNSGVMFGVSLGDEAPYISGPEFQVLDDENHPDGKSELTSAGSLYGMYAPKNKKARAAGTWNSARIIVDGNSVTHYLNGAKVVEAEIGSNDWNERLDASKFKDWGKYARNSRGHIAFQDHGDEVWFRNIRIKDLKEAQTAAGGRSDARSSARGRPAASGGRPSTGRRPNFSSAGSGLEPDKDQDDDRGNSSTRNDSRSSTRSDSRGSTRGGPPPAIGRPSTGRRPNFSSAGSGLQADDDEEMDDDRGRSSTRNDSRSSTRSDSRGSTRGGPPPAIGRPSTGRRPNFSSAGSGLQADDDEEMDDDRGRSSTRNDSRSSTRNDSRGSTRGGPPPAIGRPSTGRRPNFSSAGSGLQADDDEEMDDDRGRSSTRNDSRGSTRGGPPPAIGRPSTGRRPNFSSAGSGLQADDDEEMDDDRGRSSTRNDTRSSTRNDSRGSTRGGPPPAIGRPSTGRRPNFSSAGSGLQADDDEEMDDDRGRSSTRNDSRSSTRNDSRGSTRGGPPPAIGRPSTGRRPNFSSAGSGLQADDDEEMDDDRGRSSTRNDTRSSTRNDSRGSTRGGPPPAIGRPSTGRRPNFSSAGSGLQADDDEEMDDDRGRSSTRNDSRSSTRSDSRGSTRGGPPPAIGRPSTGRRPNFSSAGSGLQADDDKEMDDDRGRSSTRNDSRSSTRSDSRGSTRGGSPPAKGRPSTGRRPNFSSAGSALQPDKAKDADKDEDKDEDKDADKDKDKDEDKNKGKDKDQAKEKDKDKDKENDDKDKKDK